MTPVVAVGKATDCGTQAVGPQLTAINKRIHVPSYLATPASPAHGGCASPPPCKAVSPGADIPEPGPGLWGTAVCAVTGCAHSSSFAVKCLECKTVSDTYDPYLDVTLEVEVLLQGWGSLLLRGVFLL